MGCVAVWAAWPVGGIAAVGAAWSQRQCRQRRSPIAPSPGSATQLPAPVLDRRRWEWHRLRWEPGPVTVGGRQRRRASRAKEHLSSRPASTASAGYRRAAKGLVAPLVSPRSAPRTSRRCPSPGRRTAATGASGRRTRNKRPTRASNVSA